MTAPARLGEIAQGFGPSRDASDVTQSTCIGSAHHQRCDLIVDEHGALRVVVAGDWVSDEHVDVLSMALSELPHFVGPMSMDLSELGELAPRAQQVLDGVSRQRRGGGFRSFSA